MAFEIFKRIRRRHRRPRYFVDNKVKSFFKTKIESNSKSNRRFSFLLIRRKRCLRDSDNDIHHKPQRQIKNIEDSGRESSSSRSNGNGSSSNLSYSGEHLHDTNVAEINHPPKRLLRKKETMTFMIHGFAQCAKKRGQYCLSPELKAHGYNWRLQLYPRGNHRSDGTLEHMSCFLHYFSSHRDRQAPFAKAEYVCGAYKTETQVCDFAIEKGKRSCCWGLENFIRRDRVLRNCLDEKGTLIIKVNIQIAVDRKTVWYPSRMIQEPTLLQLYHSIEETGDTTFRLTFESTKYGNAFSQSKSQSNSKYYKAHKMILALRARILYEFVSNECLPKDEEEEDDATAVDLAGVDPEAFEAMLQHIYTVQQPIIRDEEMARKLLVVADRFCLTDLKMYLESILVDRFATASNAASLLLFADSYSCALLKERTMDLYTNNPDSVMCTKSWLLVEESKRILSELSQHVYTGSLQQFHQENDFCRLDVFSLRELLSEHGLAVDGSRQTLVRRLRKALGPKMDTE